MVGDLSHAIVLFPEAPGSYAEAGYFSAKDALAEKTILALDLKWQGHDSFISMGPARKFNILSRFHGIIQTSYSDPNFDDIVKRLNRISLSKNRKNLEISKFSNLSNYEIFCIIYKLFDILTIATIEDIDFMMNSIFETHFSRPRVKQILSILLGSNYIASLGEYGHYYANSHKRDVLKILSGRAHEENSIYLELGAIYVASGIEFRSLVEDAQNAA